MSKRRTGVFLSAAFVSAFALWGCGSPESNLPPRDPCPEGSPGCITTTGGGSGSGSGGNSSSSGAGGAGGGTTSNDVSGTVITLAEPTFSVSTPYLNDATILTISAAAQPISAPYGAAMPKFSLSSVMNGLTWFFVRDETVGAAGILSTHSVLSVPVAGAVTLPVVDRNMLSTIIATLPAPALLDTAKSHLVMKIARNGQPLSGVKLSTSLPGAIIAYDDGPGIYTNQAQQTGAAGVVIAFNVDAAQTPELRQLQVTDAVGQAFIIEIQMSAGSASFAGYTLQ